MIKIAEDIAFVNQQLLFHEKRADAFSKNPKDQWRQKIHLETAAKFKQLSEHLIELQKQADSPPPIPKTIPAGQQLSLTFKEIEGLPDELVKELSISDGDKTEFAITTLIEQAGGLLSLDKILIGLYKETGEIYKRQNLTNRLYRMIGKGIIYSVPGKKGAYSTEELTAEDVERLLNPKGEPT